MHQTFTNVQCIIVVYFIYFYILNESAGCCLLFSLYVSLCYRDLIVFVVYVAAATLHNINDPCKVSTHPLHDLFKLSCL